MILHKGDRLYRVQGDGLLDRLASVSQDIANGLDIDMVSLLYPQGAYAVFEVEEDVQAVYKLPHQPETAFSAAVKLRLVR